MISLFFFFLFFFLFLFLIVLPVHWFVGFDNRRSSETQGTALGKCLRAWSYISRSMPAGIAQSRHAFVLFVST